MCIMTIYGKKDSLNKCETSFALVRTCQHWKNEKMQVVIHLNYGIRVSYFWSGLYMLTSYIFHFS